MNKNGIFSSGSTISKRDYEEDKKSDVSVYKMQPMIRINFQKNFLYEQTKTISEKDIDDPFISNNGTIDLAESSDFSKDNSSSSSSIETARDSFKSASFDNKPHPEEGEIE
ncbi:18605_t:CDS:2 [Funneliformis geosporum]|nr:18605_t:CDS:2 [Funneliformis geosporum]